MRTIKFGLAALVLLASACGGGGGGGGGGAGYEDEPDTPSVVGGVWLGGVYDGINAGKIAMIRDDGEFWLVSMVQAFGIGYAVEDLTHGRSQTSDGAFTSSSARHFDFSTLGASEAMVAARYIEMQPYDNTLDGTVSYEGGDPEAFSLSYDAESAESLDLQKLAGAQTPDAFVGYAGFARHATATWQADGSLTGTTVDGCMFSAQLGPDAQGRLYAAQVDTLASVPHPEDPDARVCVGEHYVGVAYAQAPGYVIFAATNAHEDDSFTATIPARID